MRADAPNVRFHRRDIALGGASFLGALLLVLFWPGIPHVQQPIQYNHQKHLNLGLQCSDCHTLYANTPWAGLPKTETCAQCHQEASIGTAEEAKLLQFVKKSEPLPWKQVNQLPAHVYFSHQTHAVSAGIDCTTCHGDMKGRMAPPTKPFFVWKMDTCLVCSYLHIRQVSCLRCHEQRGATQDCDGCHR
jgi:hypothetical protein